MIIYNYIQYIYVIVIFNDSDRLGYHVMNY